MELHLFVNRERENLFLARQISERQRGAVMAFIPDQISVHFLFKFELDVDRFGSRRGVDDSEVVSAGALVLNSPANLLFLY